MPKTSLIKTLREDFSQLSFQPSDRCSWSPATHTVYYTSHDTDQLFHELGHATLGHERYDLDISLLEMERSAWASARSLAARYHHHISEKVIQADLDTYREWLHARSSCPTCSSTGLQTSPDTYTCLSCTTVWQVNDSRICGLRRYVLTK